MSDSTWNDWLGPAAEQMSTEQRARFEDEAATIHARYPHKEDEREQREAALSATVQWLLGETATEEVGRRLVAARSEREAAYAAARQVARLAVLDGAAEATTARAVSVDRMVLRGDLGK